MLIDNVSKEIDLVIEKVEGQNINGTNIARGLATGKEMLLQMVRRNIETEINTQTKLSGDIDSRIANWNDGLENKEFSKMENEYNEITKIATNLMPTEKLQSDIRKLENIHHLIKNNGKNFNLSEYEKKTAEILA